MRKVEKYGTYRITVKKIIEQTYEHYGYSKKNAKRLHEYNDNLEHINSDFENVKVLKIYKPKISLVESNEL
jgi:hypothetical protein